MENTINEKPIADKHIDDIQDIITKVPSWILRWGITVFFGILLMVVVISIIVRYPDTIKATIKLESSEASMPIVTVTSSRVTKLFIKQNAFVQKGQTLAITTNVNNPSETNAIISPQAGQAEFVAIVEPGVLLKPNQVIFNIRPINELFFGVLEILPGSINKIKTGQQVLISLKNYPAEEYGQLKGRIAYIADEPGKDGFFAVKATLNKSELKRPINLKTWMFGDAQIITDDISVGSRIYKSVLKGLK